MVDPLPDSQPARTGRLLEASGVTVTFPGPKASSSHGAIIAVRDVSFDVWPGETLALVGESGSGKSTTARAVMHVEHLSEGKVLFDGVDFASLPAKEQRRLRRRFQIILQDPQASLDPRRRVGATIKESLEAADQRRDGDRRDEIAQILTTVGLSPEHADRYPHELSGGQQQRVSIARALAMRPDLIVCDEPVSALDVSVQAQIINLLRRLQKDLGLAYLFIAHDLAVVRYMADRIAVMYLGSIVEMGRSEDIYSNPAHPYTAALLSSVLTPDADLERSRERIRLTGEIPRPDQPPSGCHFHPRCPLWKELGEPSICSSVRPELMGALDQHRAACHFSDKLAERLGPARSPLPATPEPLAPEGQASPALGDQNTAAESSNPSEQHE